MNAQTGGTDMSTPTTRVLLACGVAAGPIYIATGIGQGLLREEFSFARHPLSVLANGDWGWVQTLNFVVCGALVIAAAFGIARQLGRGGRSTSVLIAGHGLGMIAAAIFPSDPMDGFPADTPLGPPTTISPTGLGHFIAGALTFLFLGLSALFAWRAFKVRGSYGLARMSLIAGILVLVGFFGGAGTGFVAGVWLAVVAGWAWLSALCLALRTR